MLTIYGASDDLIEIEGDLREEFSHFFRDDDKRYLAFSDGTVLQVTYDDRGVWRFTRIAEGSASYSKTGEDSDHTERVSLDGAVRWVVFGEDFHRVKVRGDGSPEVTR